MSRYLRISQISFFFVKIMDFSNVRNLLGTSEMFICRVFPGQHGNSKCLPPNFSDVPFFPDIMISSRSSSVPPKLSYVVFFSDDIEIPSVRIPPKFPQGSQGPSLGITRSTPPTSKLHRSATDLCNWGVREDRPCDT